MGGMWWRVCGGGGEWLLGGGVRWVVVVEV